MPAVSFKSAIMAIFTLKTPTADLIPCTDCGGPNKMGKVSTKVDCTTCDQTGYENFWTQYVIPVYYSSRAYTRWNAVAGGLVQLGEATIKVDARHREIVNDAKFVHVRGADWLFQRVHEPGQTFGQERLILALSRK